jgi:hypothetical protein
MTATFVLGYLALNAVELSLYYAGYKALRRHLVDATGQIALGLIMRREHYLLALALAPIVIGLAVYLGTHIADPNTMGFPLSFR